MFRYTTDFRGRSYYSGGLLFWLASIFIWVAILFWIWWLAVVLVLGFVVWCVVDVLLFDERRVAKKERARQIEERQRLAREARQRVEQSSARFLAGEPRR